MWTRKGGLLRMKKRETKVIALKFVERAMKKRVQNQISDWPVCNGIFYQSKRPKK